MGGSPEGRDGELGKEARGDSLDGGGRGGRREAKDVFLETRGVGEHPGRALGSEGVNAIAQEALVEAQDQAFEGGPGALGHQELVEMGR
jgi:hypothetical protein